MGVRPSLVGLERGLEVAFRVVESGQCRGENAEIAGHGSECGARVTHGVPMRVRREKLVEPCGVTGLGERRTHFGEHAPADEFVVVGLEIEVDLCEVLDEGPRFRGSADFGVESREVAGEDIHGHFAERALGVFDPAHVLELGERRSAPK
jgi:hypothetical protein